MKYRPDIDGLRAIAVLGVILCHTGFAFIPGGFTGVDIFFTISGYLITGIILTQLDQGTFTFSHFYIRRTRRLFPALLAVVAACLVTGLALFSADQTLRLAKSAGMALGALSNLHFAAEIGYWDVAAATKPLLHTWSLGVEEQFYLVWPIALYAMHKTVLRLHAGLVFRVLAAASLLVTGYVTLYQSANLAFYLSPFRAYEFLVGAALFASLSSAQINKRTSTADALSLTGFALIAISLLLFDEEMPLPGYLALVPCLGTACIIATPRGIISRRLLGQRFVVWLGKISYSLYLVHWPILAFYRYRNPGAIGTSAALLLLLATAGAATLLHYLVEVPLRLKNQGRGQLSNRAFSLIVLPPLGASLLLVSLLIAKDGKLRVFGETELSGIVGVTLDEVNRRRSSIRSKACGVKSNLCDKPIDNGTNVILIGDSHGLDGYNILSTMFPGVHVIDKAKDGCPPLHNLEGLTYANKDCAAYNTKMWREIRAMHRVGTIAVSMRLARERLPETLRLVQELRSQGFKVIVFGVGPTFRAIPLDVSAKLETFSSAEEAIRGKVNKAIFPLNRQLKIEIEKLGALYIDKLSYFCPNDECRIFTEDRKELVSFDQHHLSLTAAKEFAAAVGGDYMNALEP